MEQGKFTNDIYVPLIKLGQMDPNILAFVKEYRLQFTNIVSFANMYGKIVETPELIKKRYVKNVAIANKIDIKVVDNDFIMEIAKKLVSHQKLPISIPKKELRFIEKEFYEEGNDLTLVVNWLIEEIDRFIIKEKELDLRRVIPEISKKDEKFIKAYNETTKFYSIEDYIEYVSCSYETARSSLERLTSLKLFVKDKQGKRFIFRPTNKLQLIMKGGV